MESPSFRGARLRLARDFHGLTQAEVAQRIGTSAAFVCLLEQDRKQPSPDTLAALSDALSFSPGFFAAPVVGEFRDDECHFRRRRTTPLYLRNQALAHGTLFASIVEYLDERLSLPPCNPPSFPATTRAEVERAAEKSRAAWGLGLDVPITSMMRVLEQRAGAVATSFAGISEKIDAFSRPGPRDVVVYNPAKESTSRTWFDLAHELGHLVMHRGMETGVPEREDQANQFAAAFLLPRAGFLREFRPATSIHWEHVFALKRRWHASAAAIVRRAYDLQLIGAAQYQRAYKYIHARGWHRGEPEESPAEAPELIPLAFAELERTAHMTPWSVANDLKLDPGVLELLTGHRVRVRPPGRPRRLEAVGGGKRTP